MNHWKKPFNILLLALAACLLLGAGALAAEEEAAPYTVFGFTDIAGTEYESDITVMCSMGLAVGYSDNTFRPGRAYTRLEAAELVVDLLGLNLPEDYENPYFDTADIAGSEAVDTAVAGGFMTGRSADRFDPYGSMLKAEFMSVLTKIAESLGTEDLISKIGEDLAPWAEDYTVITAAEAMHAARGMIMSLEAKISEEEAEEPSGEPAAEETAEETEVPAAEEEAVPTEEAEEAAEPVTEEVIAEEDTEEPAAEEDAAPAEEVTEDAEPAEEADEAAAEEAESAEESEEAETTEAAKDATEAPSGEPSEEMPESAPSAEPSAEMSQPEAPAEEAAAPAAPQGVLTPAPEAPVQTQAPAAPAAPQAPAVPATPQATQMPEINPDDPGAEMKTTVYSFYANIRDQLVSFFVDLLG